MIDTTTEFNDQIIARAKLLFSDDMVKRTNPDLNAFIEFSTHGGKTSDPTFDDLTEELKLYYIHAAEMEMNGSEVHTPEVDTSMVMIPPNDVLVVGVMSPQTNQFRIFMQIVSDGNMVVRR